MNLATINDIEVPFHDTVRNVMGTCDARIQFGGMPCALEIKSINDKGFNQVVKYGAEAKHIEQANVYMWALNLKRSYIFYENKNDQHIYEYVADYDQATVDALLGKAKTLGDLHAKKQLAPRIQGASPSTPPCRWCEYSHLCFNKFEEDKWMLSLAATPAAAAPVAVPKKPIFKFNFTRSK